MSQFNDGFGDFSPQLENKKFPPKELLAMGIYDATCYMVVDMGTVYNEMYKTKSRKVKLFFELPKQLIEFEDRGTKQAISKPRVFSKDFSFFVGISSKTGVSKLRQFIDQWAGKPLGDDYYDSFNVFSLIGKKAKLIISQKLKTDGAFKNEITSIGLHDSPNSIQQIHPSSRFSAIDPRFYDSEVNINNIPLWVIQDLVKSDEFMAWRLENPNKLSYLEKTVLKNGNTSPSDPEKSNLPPVTDNPFVSNSPANGAGPPYYADAVPF